MGCCASRPSSERTITSNHAPTSSNRPYAANAAASDHASSRRNITAQSPRPSSRSYSQSHSNKTSNRLNNPLVPLPPDRHPPLPNPLSFPTSTTSARNPSRTPWTPSKLAQERRDWWETRDSGTREIWAAYRRMVELLRAGDLVGAQTLLDASGCTCPTGKLWKSIFDERGVEYAITDPARRCGFEWLVFDPAGLAAEEEEEDSEISSGDNVDGSAADARRSRERRRTLDKGKGRADADDDDGADAVGSRIVNIRCRLSTTGRDHVIPVRQAQRGDAIHAGAIMSKLSRITGLEYNRHRISYLGRVFAAHETLPTSGPGAWKEGNILTVLVLGD